jgi:N,N'-diacetyllegionaminate synthase
MKIGTKEIGPGQKVFIIAEACDNHFGSVTRAMQMVDTAKLAGCDAIKFQHHLPDEEMLKDVPRSDNFEEDSLYDFIKKNALSLAEHKRVAAYCKKKGIIYLCTPFSWAAAKQIAPLVPAFKIGSGELMDWPTLEKIAGLGKPMILSTGMSTPFEIRSTVDFLLPQAKGLCVMNCTSEYPPKYADINLGFIDTLRNDFEKRGIVIGHSDHTPDNYTCFAAVAKGAKVIEKHFCIDKDNIGPDMEVSLWPEQLQDLCFGIRAVELALGSTKKVNALEQPIREWARRSVVTITPIKKGTKFGKNNLWCKRPGTGIPSTGLYFLFGKKAKKDLPANVLLKDTDVEGGRNE